MASATVNLQTAPYAKPTKAEDAAAPVDRRFRVVFALAAAALVAINAGVAINVLCQQRQIRDRALGLYDHAFVANNDINNARVEFQRFADARAAASNPSAVAKANALLDGAADALDAAADRADEPGLREERLSARASVLAFKQDLEFAGTPLATQLRYAQDTLDAIADHALARGLQAREEINEMSNSSTWLLIDSMFVGAALGLVTLLILRRTIALSTMSRLSHMANYDAVTGLPNRNLLQKRLTDCLEGVRKNDRSLALLTIDLDRFKQVNDTLGHQVGDLLLVEAGERIRGVTRTEDTAARFGGDEFVVLMRDSGDPAEAAAIAARLVTALSAPYEFNGQRVLAGASVGIALAPQHGETAEELLRSSDLALYQAKAAGKGTYRFFDSELNEVVQARRLMEIDLRETIEQDRLEVYFQPMIDVASGRVVSCEALARWSRPGIGFVRPDQFIPLAEETGLILPLGEAVLRKACNEAAKWPNDICVSVNLSARQFQGADLVALVRDALAASDFPAKRLELEITESILVGDKSHVLEVLNELRALGVHIALDDFGTGYSSLSYLSSFPFDRIKIDRSFVTDVGSRPDAAAIVRAVTGLAETLGMSTTAEGVETQHDLEWLKAQGCDIAQGYLVSRPIPAGELDEFLETHRMQRARAA